MKISTTPIAGLLVIEPTVFSDHRGYFFESFRSSILEEHVVDLRFVQDNESKSDQGVLRGLHLQAPPFGQAKLLRVVHGAIYDVAVDIRIDSPTYGQYYGLELNGENKKMLFIPEGFAHGFCCLENDSIVQYKCSNYYSKAHEMGIRWDDPTIGIPWPVDQPSTSEKDNVLPSLNDFKSPF